MSYGKPILAQTQELKNIKIEKVKHWKACIWKHYAGKKYGLKVRNLFLFYRIDDCHLAKVLKGGGGDTTMLMTTFG